jgi:hypothetical protein
MWVFRPCTHITLLCHRLDCVGAVPNPYALRSHRALFVFCRQGPRGVSFEALVSLARPAGQASAEAASRPSRSVRSALLRACLGCWTWRPGVHDLAGG